VLVMIALVTVVARAQGGLAALLACVVISRGAHLGFSFAFGSRYFGLKVSGVDWSAVRAGLMPSMTIGAAGLLLVVYEALDVVLLSRMAATADVAYYSGAQKFAWPLLMALSAVGTTFYSVVASHWPHSRAQFEAACQRAFDTVVLLAAIPLCSILAGAEFFMGLLGPELVPAAPALRLLALLCVAKAISMTVGPVLYIVHAQGLLLRLVALALGLKAVLVLAVAPGFGFMGAAAVGLALEVLFAGVTVHLAWKRTGYRVQWRTALRAGFIVAVSAGAALVAVSSSLVSAMLAPVLCVALMFAAGLVSRASLRTLLAMR
jgi:O-antigen/teichoic acid export membrane protein